MEREVTITELDGFVNAAHQLAESAKFITLALESLKGKPTTADMELELSRILERMRVVAIDITLETEDLDPDDLVGKVFGMSVLAR